MENRNDDGLLKLIVYGGLIYAIYCIVAAVTEAIFALLMGLVHIALGAAGVFAAYWLYQYITNKQYGETKKLQQIEKLERERKHLLTNLPKHLREEASEHIIDKQREFFNQKPQSRAEVMLQRIGQVFNLIRKKGKDE